MEDQIVVGHVGLIVRMKENQDITGLINPGLFGVLFEI
jgi:hypothetical protein